MDKPSPTNSAPAPADDMSFLPDFCTVRVLLQVVLIGELIAFILALSPVQSSGDRWTSLALISLFVQWVGLTSTALLCASRSRLQRLGNIAATVYGYGVILALTAITSAASVWLGSHIEVAVLAAPDRYGEFVLCNLAISFIVATVALRYFYLQHQSQRQIEAEGRARLAALQARIRPHFLFNSMNTIASLIRTRPDRAERAVEDLADLFRASLNDVGGLATLGEELELTRRYLNIEALRLGERLTVEWDLAGLPDEALIPVFMVQPLVENAIYHGIEPLAEGGTIRVAGRAAGDMITLTITNPVAGPGAATRHGNHMAIANIRARLAAHYADRGRLTVEHDDTRFIASITFPYRRADAS